MRCNIAHSNYHVEYVIFVYMYIYMKRHIFIIRVLNKALYINSIALAIVPPGGNNYYPPSPPLPEQRRDSVCQTHGRHFAPQTLYGNK